MKKILLIVASVLAFVSVQAKDLVLSEDNSLILSGPFTGDSTSQLMEQAKKKDANLPSGYPLYLFLYTPGGEIQAGLTLVEYLKGLNRPIHTITMFAASMGFQTVQQLGKRYIIKYGTLMSHKARGSFSGEFGGGPSQLDSRYGMWLRRIEMMDKETVVRTEGKQTLKSYRSAYATELWLNGPEAVKQGYADSVVSLKCDSSLVGTNTVVLDLRFFRIKVTLSKCPINVTPLSVEAMVYTNKGEMLLQVFLSKGGSFDKTCGEVSKQQYDPYEDYSGIYTSAQKNISVDKRRLCLTNKDLTLQYILKKKREAKDKYNRNLKDHIIYSY